MKKFSGKPPQGNRVDLGLPRGATYEAAIAALGRTRATRLCVSTSHYYMLPVGKKEYDAALDQGIRGNNGVHASIIGLTE